MVQHGGLFVCAVVNWPDALILRQRRWYYFMRLALRWRELPYPKLSSLPGGRPYPVMVQLGVQMSSSHFTSFWNNPEDPPSSRAPHWISQGFYCDWIILQLPNSASSTPLGVETMAIFQKKFPASKSPTQSVVSEWTLKELILFALRW